jgi:hypothetical protein
MSGVRPWDRPNAAPSLELEQPYLIVDTFSVWCVELQQSITKVWASGSVWAIKTV